MAEKAQVQAEHQQIVASLEEKAIDQQRRWRQAQIQGRNRSASTSRGGRRKREELPTVVVSGRDDELLQDCIG